MCCNVTTELLCPVCSCLPGYLGNCVVSRHQLCVSSSFTAADGWRHSGDCIQDTSPPPPSRKRCWPSAPVSLHCRIPTDMVGLSTALPFSVLPESFFFFFSFLWPKVFPAASQTCAACTIADVNLGRALKYVSMKNMYHISMKILYIIRIRLPLSHTHAQIKKKTLRTLEKQNSCIKPVLSTVDIHFSQIQTLLISKRAM